MRGVIWKKDDFFQFLDQEPKVTMDPSGVTFKDSVPLSWQYNWGAASPGQVTNMRLEDGEIVGEVEVFDANFTEKSLDELDVRFGGYYTDVKRNEDGTVVLKATLSGVAIVKNSDMPKAP